MRILAVYFRGMKEQVRDVLNFVLTISTTPLFILLYFSITSGGTTAYPIVMINYDTGKSSAYIVEEIKALVHEDGKPLMKVSTGVSETKAREMIVNREAVMCIIIPENFSKTFDSGNGTASVIFRGDPSHPYYMMCAAFVWNCLDSMQIAFGKKQEGPIAIREEFAGTALVKTEFENYVPGLLVISVIMLVFIAAVNIARDRENGVFLRYRMSTSPASAYLTGNLLVFLTMAALAIGASLLTAAVLGFRFNGSWSAVVLILMLSVFPILALGVLCGVFVKSAIKAYLISSFPFLFLMFFSGSVFPIPEVILFSIGDWTIRLFDFIPTYHAVRAMTKVLCYDQTIIQIGPELAAMTILSVFFYIPVLILVRQKLKMDA